MKLGILGGTFDPIHIGHLVLAECARDQLGLDRVLFLPAGDPWRKAGRRVAAAEHRLRMVRLALADNEAFDADERELRRLGPSYTVETLRELRAELGPDAALYFLLGEDALADLPFWRDPAGIVALATLVIAPRQGAAAADRELVAGARVECLDMPYIGISSTDVRERLARGASVRYMLPAAVEAYAREQGLYGSSR